MGKNEPSSDQRNQQNLRKNVFHNKKRKAKKYFSN